MLGLLTKWEELAGFDASGLHAQCVRRVRQPARAVGDLHAHVTALCEAVVWPVNHARWSFAGSS
jgi:hypothetical protein